MQPLNKEELEFVDLYVGECDFNAAEAYRRVKGISDTSSKTSSAAYKYRKRKHVAAAINERLEERVGPHEEIANRILDKLKQHAFADNHDDVLTPKVQQDAIKLLQKQLGLEINKLQHEGGLDLNIKWDDGEEDDKDD